MTHNDLIGSELSPTTLVILSVLFMFQSRLIIDICGGKFSKIMDWLV
jgi:hypothetical protein